MPELPDVEVFRRRLALAVRGRSLRGATVHDSQVLAGVGARRLHRSLAGSRVRSTRRRGKTLYAVTRGGPHLRLHFGMTGDLVVADAAEEEPAYTRVVLPLSGDRALHFVDQRKLGEIGLVDDVDADIEEHGLGPDALDLGPRDLIELLRGSRAGLKVLLMDQSEVAGLGNIYTDEMLFQARLDPHAPAAEITDAGVRRAYRQLHRVVDRAVRAGAQPDEMPRGWLLHRRRSGADCPRGNGQIARFSLGGRHGFWCPACQKGRT